MDLYKPPAAHTAAIHLGRIINITPVATHKLAEDISAEEIRRGELEPLTFGQVVGVGPKYEASRTFASMLQARQGKRCGRVAR